jgi:hypothetical protein
MVKPPIVWSFREEGVLTKKKKKEKMVYKHWQLTPGFLIATCLEDFSE